ncbi:MAG: hypothetical protein ACXAC6_01780 [Candidatus Hodarchaeales archaeon]|jgi:hypothetical protein
MDTIDIIGIIFVVLGIIFYLLLGTRLFRSYRRTDKKQTLYLSLLFLLGGLALAFLMLEQVSLLLTLDPPETYSQVLADAVSILQFSELNSVFLLAFIFAVMAWITSGLAIVSANFFTQSFFPNSNKKLLIIPILLIAAYLVIIIFSPFYFEYVTGSWSPEHDPSTTFILWVLFLAPLWIVVLLFLYLSISLKRKGNIAWRRVGWLFFSQVVLSVGFTIEILNPSTFTPVFTGFLANDAIWSLGSRFMIMSYAILMWIAMYTPNWAKGMLGASRT